MHLLNTTPLQGAFYGVSFGLLMTVLVFLFLLCMYAYLEKRKNSATVFFYTGLANVFYMFFYMYMVDFLEPNLLPTISPWLLLLGKLSIPIVVIINYHTFINSLPIGSLEDYAIWQKAKKSFRFLDSAVIISLVSLPFINNFELIIIIALLLTVLENVLSIKVTKDFEKRYIIKKLYNMLLVAVVIVSLGLSISLAVNGLGSLTESETITLLTFFAMIMVIHSFVLIQNDSKNSSLKEQSSKLKSQGFFRDVYQALNNDEFSLIYQPKIRLDTGKICGVETLIRWEHPTKGLISSNDFIPTAERTAVINNICEWVIEHAVRDAKKLRERGVDVPVAINFSVTNISTEMANFLINTLIKHKLPSSSVIVEINESIFLDMTENQLLAIKEMNRAKIKISLDDFGAGYSSIRQIDKLLLSEVKIDHNIIRNMVDDKQKAVVESLVNMCHILGIEVVAEGINDENTMNDLLAMDCQMGQGYAICRPKPLEDFVEWATANINSDEPLVLDAAEVQLNKESRDINETGTETTIETAEKINNNDEVLTGNKQSS